MIIRTHKAPGKWFQMHKQPVENERLSWKAKGILAYLMSKPSDWIISTADLEKRSADGESALRSGLEELERAGYLVRRREHDEKTGQFIWISIVHETPAPLGQRSDPDARKQPSPDLPSVENPQMDNPQVENHQGTKNDSTKNDSTKNKRHHHDAAQPNGHHTKIRTMYEQRLGLTLSGIAFDDIDELWPRCQDLAWWKRAFEVAAEKANGDPWRYAVKVLRNALAAEDRKRNQEERQAIEKGLAWDGEDQGTTDIDFDNWGA